MSEAFSAKLALVLKALSLSRGQLAAELGIDKSVAGRWVTGAAQPSSHNLSLLTALIAARAPGFTLLDWDQTSSELAMRLGVRPGGAEASRPTDAEPALPAAILDQIYATSTLRGSAYEGIFRSTRPYVMSPGQFLHDHGMIRRDANGLLRLTMRTADTVVNGWMLTLQNQLFCIAADVTSGALVFGIFNGVATAKADVLDGLSLGSALDAGRTPTATAMIFERVADLTDDPDADDRLFVQLASGSPLAPEGSIPEAIRQHLTRDIGPAQAALGGDLLLRMPVSRSIARGPIYEALTTT